MGTYTETSNYALRKPDAGGLNWDEHINYDIDQIDQILANKSDITHNHDADYVKLTDYEDADVLAKLQNVDGDGSGLDADTVDGYHASQTPTANSIPVADTNNKIDDGWLSTIPACMVRLSADQALVANTYSKIQFDTVDYDILSNFDNANYHFTVPQSGLYQIAAIVNFYVSDATSTVRTIRVYVNDVAANGMAQQTSTGDAHTTVSLSAILSLNAGDTVSIYGCSDAINDNIVGLEYSSLYICRIR